jgi:hypothetical protein
MSDQESSRPETPPSVYDHVTMLIQQMAHVSWSKLGLQPDTISGKLEQNLPEAKVAIDVVAHLAGVLDSQLDEADRRQIQGMVRDLRLNYVQKTAETGS